MVQAEARVTEVPGPLTGIRILDFTWVRAGPWCTRWLGGLGAEVIKVESPNGPSTRGNLGQGGLPEGIEGPPTLNTAGGFNDGSANKLSITLNPRTPRGNDLVKRLVAISDVVIENFAYGAMQRWGIGYEEMKSLNSDIIYVSMSGFGHTGRNRSYLTMGPVAQALSGLTYTSGLPGEAPAGWGWSYMDDSGGLFGAMYTLSAIYHRNITGEGQHVDMSQWITGVPLNGAAFLDIQANQRSTIREGYPPGNRAHWPGTPLLNNYRERTVAPHNAYKTNPEGYNDWCVIACFTDDEWKRLVGLMGSPAWAADKRYETLRDRLKNQEELDRGIEEWTKSIGKYEIMQLCQAAGIPAMPVQSNQDRVENDPQLKFREMYREMEHPIIGTWPLQNAPFKMSGTPIHNAVPAPLIGGHNKEIFEGLLGINHEEFVAGFEDGTFWPKDFDMSPYPYLADMIADNSEAKWSGNTISHKTGIGSRNGTGGTYQGLRVLELSDAKGQWCGKLLGDMGADVIKIEPPGGESTRTIGPFYKDIPDRNRSLYFWHYNTSKRGVTLDIQTPDGRDLFKSLANTADVIIETFKPGYMASLGLSYEDLKVDNPGLVMCSLTPFGQTGPWKDYVTSDLLHLAAGGQMASCGYTEEGREDSVPDAPPIAPGGGQSWHMGGEYAYIAIAAALVHRTVTGEGQYIDASIHEACALTTEGAVTTYIYRKQVVRRQTGRHASPIATDRTQHLCKDGKYVNAMILNRLNPERLKMLAEWMDSYDLAGDLLEDKYQDQPTITQNQAHINGLLLAFFASITQDEAYHGIQERDFAMGAVRSPDEVLQDPHLDDRGFWENVEYPEVGETFRHPGPAGIFNGSPWRISRRAPLMAEHNEEVFCKELGLTHSQLAILAESGII